MTRKRWIVVGVSSIVACLLLAGVAGVLLVRNVPGVARLVRGDPASTTPRATLRATFTPRIEIATLTPEPTSTGVEDIPTLPPGASAEPTATATRAQATASSAPAAGSPAAGTPTESPTPTPEPPTPTATPRPEWIAFETKRGSSGDYEIFVMAPDGSSLANVTNSWADDVAPVWSPDGRWIAFVSFRDTLTGKWGLENGSVYIMDFDPATGTAGGTVRRLTDNKGSEGWPTWSPDGKRVAFQSDRGDSWDIWSIKIDGTGLVQLTNAPGADRYPAWSPDGRQLAFTSKRSGNEDIWVIDVQAALGGQFDAKARNLTNFPSRDRYAMWSRDGKRLTFNTKRDGDFEVYIMMADGSNPQNVSRSPKSTEGLADWSPDGKRLVFYSDRPGNKDVFVLDLASGAWTNISNDPASDEFSTWSP